MLSWLLPLISHKQADSPGKTWGILLCNPKLTNQRVQSLGQIMQLAGDVGQLLRRSRLLFCNGGNLLAARTDRLDSIYNRLNLNDHMLYRTDILSTSPLSWIA